MPERTLFYGQPLLGVGTSEVESLRSFVERLAFAHRFKPRGLMETLLERYPRGSDPFDIAHVVRFWDIHGHSRAGASLMKRLEAATLTSLSASSLGRLEGVLSLSHLARTGDPAYCPLCCADIESPTHGRLLWEVQCVQACPLHRVLLRSTKVCGAPLMERLPMSSRPAMRAVCSGCGSIGFGCVSDVPEPAREGLVLAAEQIGELLALTDQEAGSLTGESLREGIDDVVSKVFAGSVVNASLDSGLARATVHTWLRGRSKPALSLLTQFCLRARASLVECMRGRFVRVQPDSAEHLGPLEDLAPRSYRRTTLSHQRIREKLEEAIANDYQGSARQLCKELGLNARDARRRFPDLMHELGRRSQLRMEAEHARLYADAVRSYQSAAQELKAEGKTVSGKYVQARAGLVAYGDNPTRVRALREAIASVTGVPAPGTAKRGS